jgi:hypothetical protein
MLCERRVAKSAGLDRFHSAKVQDPTDPEGQSQEGEAQAGAVSPIR